MLIPQVLFTIDPSLLSHYKGGFRIPRGRGANPPGGANLQFWQIFQKLHEIENILSRVF